jgi:hypothetical protein
MTGNPTQAQLSPAALRMRRSRRRHREGMRSLLIELRNAEIGELIRIGHLRPEMRNDNEAVLLALYGYLDQNLDPSEPANAATKAR